LLRQDEAAQEKGDHECDIVAVSLRTLQGVC
jgi:hypothetical protein